MKYVRLALAMPFLLCGALVSLLALPALVSMWILFNSEQLIAGTTIIDVSKAKIKIVDGD